ncbi:uncharacterized protein C8A04DRAFT_29039 [Dichotomopilus funicola]|uniref:Uncharacterized protein n=1 Tax=Dichotomopilus funicola TaxID=1934379 RepID=A0AAN6V2E9_9PEZI|nr:hypothetical protein C8A04DRAFT_29039 [Dichotomopilus funicola]
MSADTLPISPSRFAAALEELPVSTLHLKVLELRNSIAHLDYSNEQLRPFAEGTASTSSSQPQPQSQQTSQSQTQSTSETATQTQTPAFEPDQDCLEAIRENEQVIERMQERIRLVRAEVEGRRGLSWTEFQSQEEQDADAAKTTEGQSAGEGTAQVNGQVNGDHPTTNGDTTHSAWSDGTFQTGVIRDGVVQMDNDSGLGGGLQTQTQSGGSLTDEELRRRIELQMRGLGGEEEDGGEEGGLHL